MSLLVQNKVNKSFLISNLVHSVDINLYKQKLFGVLFLKMWRDLEIRKSENSVPPPKNK